MQTTEIGGDRGTDHNEMEVRDDEVSVVQMNVEGECREYQPRDAADREQADEAQRVEQRSLELNLPFVERRRPVVDLDGGRHRDGEAQERENEAGIGRLAAHEHVVAQ